jgi:hypothetical protein
MSTTRTRTRRTRMTCAVWLTPLIFVLAGIMLCMTSKRLWKAREHVVDKNAESQTATEHLTKYFYNPFRRNGFEKGAARLNSEKYEKRRDGWEDDLAKHNESFFRFAIASIRSRAAVTDPNMVRVRADILCKSAPEYMREDICPLGTMGHDGKSQLEHMEDEHFRDFVFCFRKMPRETDDINVAMEALGECQDRANRRAYDLP